MDTVLERTLARIGADLDSWDQKSWASRGNPGTCGTTYCLAGHTLVETGWRPVWRDWSDPYPECWVRYGRTIWNSGKEVAEQAARELGWTFDQAEQAFYGVSWYRGRIVGRGENVANAFERFAEKIRLIDAQV